MLVQVGCWMAQVEISALASDWPCGRCRGKEGQVTALFYLCLLAAPDGTLLSLSPLAVSVCRSKSIDWKQGEIEARSLTRGRGGREGSLRRQGGRGHRKQQEGRHHKYSITTTASVHIRTSSSSSSSSSTIEQLKNCLNNYSYICEIRLVRTPHSLRKII